MTGRAFRRLTVTQKKQLTPNMVRIILSGDELSSFPADQESGYVKLAFPVNKELADKKSEGEETVNRSYTVRAFDAQTLELTLDFVVHGDTSPASRWAKNTEVGDSISTDGPGAVKLVNMSADWFFIAGDMPALPAISVNLEKLPPHAKGYAVIEILTEADKQTLKVPAGMDIHWVINPHPDSPNTLLADAVKSVAWLEGAPNIWVASEFETMRNLRRYFKEERKVDRSQIYVSSYWKMGDTDEGNKVAKKLDVEVE